MYNKQDLPTVINRVQSRGNVNDSNATGDSGSNENSNSPSIENDSKDNGGSNRESMSTQLWESQLAEFRVPKRFVPAFLYSCQSGILCPSHSTTLLLCLTVNPILCFLAVK